MRDRPEETVGSQRGGEECIEGLALPQSVLKGRGGGGVPSQVQRDCARLAMATFAAVQGVQAGVQEAIRARLSRDEAAGARSSCTGGTGGHTGAAKNDAAVHGTWTAACEVVPAICGSGQRSDWHRTAAPRDGSADTLDEALHRLRGALSTVGQGSQLERQQAGWKELASDWESRACGIYVGTQRHEP